MSQSPITVTYTLEDVLTRLEGKIDKLSEGMNHKIDKLGEKVDHLTVEVATIKTKVDSLENDVKELKSSQKAQIWSLIILSFTAVLGLLGTIATVAIKLFFQPV